VFFHDKTLAMAFRRGDADDDNGTRTAWQSEVAEATLGV
jgi:hypothetical protein